MSSLVAASGRGQTPGPGPAAPLTQTSSFVETVPAVSADGHVIACHAGSRPSVLDQRAQAVMFDLTAACGETVETRIAPPLQNPSAVGLKEMRPAMSADGLRVATTDRMLLEDYGGVPAAYYQLRVTPFAGYIGAQFRVHDSDNGSSPRLQLSGDGHVVWCAEMTSSPWSGQPTSRFIELSEPLDATPDAECQSPVLLAPGNMQSAISSDGLRVVGDHFLLDPGLHQIWRVERARPSWCDLSQPPAVLTLANAAPTGFDAMNWYVRAFEVHPTMNADGSIVAWSSMQNHCLSNPAHGDLGSFDIWLWFENPADVPAWSPTEFQICDPPAPTPGKLVRIITSTQSSNIEGPDTHVTIDAAGDLLTFLSDRDYEFGRNPFLRPSVFALDLRAGSLATAVSQVSETLSNPQAVIAHALSSNGNVSVYTLAADDAIAFADTDLQVVNRVQGSEPRQPDARPPAEEPFEVEVTSCTPFGASVELRATIRRWRGGSRTLLLTPTVEEGSVRQTGSPIAQKLADEEFAETVLVVDTPVPMTSPTCTVTVVDGSQSHADVQVGVAP